jgi:predicted enzyme related to lactoylglutathione lyase
MPEQESPSVGSIAWRDLTVPDAEGVKEFYSAVVGWNASAVEMDGYSDFSIGHSGLGGYGDRDLPRSRCQSTPAAGWRHL